MKQRLALRVLVTTALYTVLIWLLVFSPGTARVRAASTISLRGVGTGTNGTGATSLSLAEPAGTQAGDVLIAQVVVNSASTVITAPADWTLIRTVKSSTVVEQASFFRVASPADPASYTWTLSPSQPATGGIVSFTGVDTSNPIDTSSGKFNANVAAVSFTQITTVTANEMVLALVGVGGNTTVTPPSGFTEDYDMKDAASGSGRTAEMSHWVQPTAGLTAIGNGQEDTLAASNLAQLIALRPAGGTPLPTLTATVVVSPTFTATPLLTNTPTPLPTSTSTPLPSSTATLLPANTATSAPSSTQTAMPSLTFTPTATVTPSATPTLGTGDITVAVVGDMQCSTPTCQDAHTSDLVQQMHPAAYLPLGDLVQNGAYSNFLNYYNPLWGQFRSIAYPVIGDHESGGAGYYDYWNGIGVLTGQAGTRGKGWYSFNIGTWHFVALNSNCVPDSLRVDCQPGSEEIAWLEADLSANPSQCTIAYMHHPYYSSGTRQYPELKTIFQTLYNHRVELYFAGHTHYYQRFYAQDANSNRDDTNGVAEIVVGTGGGTLANVGSVATYRNEAVQIGKTFGVLKLVLHPNSYDFQFLPAQGFTATDSGTGTCH